MTDDPHDNWKMPENKRPDFLSGILVGAVLSLAMVGAFTIAVGLVGLGSSLADHVSVNGSEYATDAHLVGGRNMTICRDKYGDIVDCGYSKNVIYHQANVASYTDGEPLAFDVVLIGNHRPLSVRGHLRHTHEEDDDISTLYFAPDIVCTEDGNAVPSRFNAPLKHHDLDHGVYLISYRGYGPMGEDQTVIAGDGVAFKIEFAGTARQDDQCRLTTQEWLGQQAMPPLPLPSPPHHSRPSNEL